MGNSTSEVPSSVVSLNRQRASAISLTRISFAFLVPSTEKFIFDGLDVACLQEPFLTLAVLDDWHLYFVQLSRHWATVGKSTPPGNVTNHPGVVFVPVGHADGYDVLVERYRTLHLQKRQIVVERLGHVALVNDHSLHVPLHRLLRLVVVREVPLAEHDDE